MSAAGMVKYKFEMLNGKQIELNIAKADSINVNALADEGQKIFIDILKN